MSDIQGGTSKNTRAELTPSFKKRILRILRLSFGQLRTIIIFTLYICREQSERLYFQDHSFSMLYPSTLIPHVINSRTGWVGWGGLGGEQILNDRTPPGRLRIFKKRLYSMNADSEQMVYVYFQNPTCHRDFTMTVFLIIWLRSQGSGKEGPGLGSRDAFLTR